MWGGPTCLGSVSQSVISRSRPALTPPLVVHALGANSIVAVRRARHLQFRSVVCACRRRNRQSKANQNEVLKRHA